MKRSLMLAVGVILVASLVAGCSKKNNSATSQDTSQPVSVRIGYMVLSDCVPLFYTNVFAKNGISLELKQAPGGAIVLDGVIGGSLDLGFSNLVSPILAQGQGIDMLAVAGCTFEDDAHSRHALMVKKGSALKGPHDLKTKIVAVNTLRNIDHLMLLRWLRLNGMAADSVKLVEVPFPRMEAVLLNGDVDAVAIVEPFMTKLRDTGISIGDYYVGADGSRIEVTSYFGKRSWIESHPDVVRRFQKALSEAMVMANNDEKGFRALIQQVTGIDGDTAQKMALPGFSAMPSDAGFKFLIKEAKDAGFIQTEVSAQNLLWTGSPSQKHGTQDQ
jgi:NitT/TauT family transport system substrate-binding protein